MPKRKDYFWGLAIGILSVGFSVLIMYYFNLVEKMNPNFLTQNNVDHYSNILLYGGMILCFTASLLITILINFHFGIGFAHGFSSIIVAHNLFFISSVSWAFISVSFHLLLGCVFGSLAGAIFGDYIKIFLAKSWKNFNTL